MTFTALCCEHSGFYQLQKVRALHELMQSYLCPAMDPILVQSHIIRPLPPASSDIGVCPDHTPTLLSTQLTLLSTQLTHLLQPFTDTSSTRPPPPTTLCHHHIQKAAPGPQTNRLPCHLPPSAFPAHLHTHSVSSCAGSVGILSHPCLSVHTGASVPEPGSSAPGPRRKVEDGTCHSLLLFQGAPVPSVFPQPSAGALAHLWVPLPPIVAQLGKNLSAV